MNVNECELMTECEWMHEWMHEWMWMNVNECMIECELMNECK